ncbi:MAG: hypothetical protein ICV81_19985, partial [Flavisolibacter sp.]|nr:hypothetical protein [Flavisolibacter sp.]
MKRSTFLKQSVKAGAVVLLSPSVLTKAETTTHYHYTKDDLLNRLVTANDAQVEKLLQTDLEKRDFSRRVAYDLAVLTA